MSTWQQILLVIFAIVFLIIFWPGARAAMEASKQAENPDWKGALLPIGAVVLFVILLIMMVKS